jgi:polysaccharide export outer membrane protein
LLPSAQLPRGPHGVVRGFNDRFVVINGVTMSIAALIALASFAEGWPQQTAPPTTATPAAQAVVPDRDPSTPYVLQRGDEISIKVFGRTDLDDTVTVRPDGRISALLADDVPAAGTTPAQLDEALTARYAKYFRDPEVSVVVRKFAAERVFVGGEVGTPGMLPLGGEMTVLSAIMQAGGFKRTARTDSVVLLRNSGGKAVAERLNLKALMSGVTDRRIQPFDVIYVPMSRIAKVDAFVDQYMRQLLPITVSAGFSYLLGDSTVLRIPQ